MLVLLFPVMPVGEAGLQERHKVSTRGMPEIRSLLAVNKLLCYEISLIYLLSHFES